MAITTTPEAILAIGFFIGAMLFNYFLIYKQSRLFGSIFFMAIALSGNVALDGSLAVFPMIIFLLSLVSFVYEFTSSSINF